MNRNFTKDEAQRIFSLAAERQQAAQKEDSNQLSIEDLEEAGLAAGIDPAFIRAAASDLLRPDRITDQRKFLGYPVEFRESHVFSMAFNETNWKKAVDIFSHVYEKPGFSREIGTTKRWSSESGENQMPANIIAEKEETGTRFTIERKTWPMALGLGIGTVINMILGLIFFGLSLSVEPDLLIAAAILTGTGILMGLGSTLGIKNFSRQELKRFENVFNYLEEMASDTPYNSEKVDAEPPMASKNNRLLLDDVEGSDTDTLQKARQQQRSR